MGGMEWVMNRLMASNQRLCQPEVVAFMCGALFSAIPLRTFNTEEAQGLVK